MKNHIVTYSQWSRVYESEHDQGYEDLKTLIDLGLASPHELDVYRKSTYGPRVRVEFMEKLRGMFRDLAINPKSMTTPIQRRRDTYVFQLTPEEAVKILFEYELPEGKNRNIATRLNTLLNRIRPHIDKLIALGDRTLNDDRAVYKFFIMPSGARLAVRFAGTPEVSSFMKFDGAEDADDLLVRFVNQVARETNSLIRDKNNTGRSVEY
jgi:hypothetical protein